MYCSTIATLFELLGGPVDPAIAIAAVCVPTPALANLAVFKAPPLDHDPAFTVGSWSLVCTVTPFIYLYVAIINLM